MQCCVVQVTTEFRPRSGRSQRVEASLVIQRASGAVGEGAGELSAYLKS